MLSATRLLLGLSVIASWATISIAVQLSTIRRSYGAEITQVDSPRCVLRVSGRITPGDAEKAKSIIATLGLNTDSASSEGIPPQKALCLNSDGGSYLAGREIAQVVHDTGLTTRIEDGASCYSACALVFMAGRIHGAENDGTSRYLNVRGHLGFHAPYFDIPDSENLTGKEAKEMVTLGQKIVAEFMQFGSFKSDFDVLPMVPTSLLTKMLAAGPNEISEVATVEDAARWRISLDGITEEEVVDGGGAVRGCLNFTAWSRDQPSDPAFIAAFKPDEGKYDVVKGKLNNAPADFVRVDTGGMEERYCLVELPRRKVGGVTICTVDDFSGERYGNCGAGWGIYLPWYYTKDPRTPLSSLAK